jgi:hypothetical protein
MRPCDDFHTSRVRACQSLQRDLPFLAFSFYFDWIGDCKPVDIKYNQRHKKQQPLTCENKDDSLPKAHRLESAINHLRRQSRIKASSLGKRKAMG